MSTVALHKFRQQMQGDPVIWGVAICLGLLSILSVYSATGALAFKKFGGNTEFMLMKQIFYVGLCFVAMWLAHRVDYRYYAKISLFALYLSIPLLILAIVVGTNINDASRWLRIPVLGITFQPSDLAKFALISYVASILARNQRNVEELNTSMFKMVLWCGAICVLIMWSNASTAIVLMLTCGLMLFIGRVPTKFIAILGLLGVLALGVALLKGQRAKTFFSRIQSVTKDEKIPFQLEQSYIAIATGGVLGKGPGNSTQRNFLPHPYSDFIYATIIEEYGLVGGAGVLFLFLVLLYRGTVTVARSERAFGGLLSAGLSFALVIQAFVNMCVAVGLGPITGLPLPLVSMGGTSLLFTGISMGIILSVSKGEVEDE